MFHARRRVLHLDVGEGVGAALVANQQGVTLRVVASRHGALQDLHLAAVGVLPVPSGNALGDDCAPRVLANVNHLGAGVGLLPVVSERHRVELAHGVVALKDDARVLPGDGRAGLHLRPGNLRVHTCAFAALGDEVIDPALARLGVPRIPVLDGRVLDLGVVVRNQLNDSSMQLVLVANRCGATFEVAHIGALIGDDQGALELARLRRVNAEVGQELHRTANPLGDVHERPVGEHGRVERGEEVVGVGHHRA